MFALVDPEGVYCLGIDTGEEAVTFRRDPNTRRTYFSISSNADAAFHLHTSAADDAELKLVRYASISENALISEDDDQ
jgi:hypothetical protein